MDGLSDVIQVDLSCDTRAGEKARRALEEINVQAAKLSAQLDSDTITWERYSAQMDALQARANKVNDAFNRSTTVLKTVANESAFSGQKLMTLAQTLDDLQYVPEQGLRPIINNVIQISPAVGVALIAIQALGKAVISLADSFGEGHVQTEAERIEELGKKAHKTAEEYEFLAKAKRGEQAVENVANARPEAESKADKATIDAIGNAGGRKAVAAALRTNDPGFAGRQPAVQQAQKNLDDMIKKAADFEGKFGKGMAYDLMGFGNAIAFLRKRLGEAKDQAYVDAMAEATKGQDTPGGRKRLAGMLRQNPKALGGKAGALADQLDAIDAGRDLDKEKKEAEQKAEHDKREAEKRRDELAKDLQGRYNLARAGGEDVSEATIRDELTRGGLKPDEVQKQAAGVLAALQKGYAEEIRERAGKKGLDQEGAARDILDEQAKKEARAAAPGQRAAEKEEREEDRRAKELAKPIQDRFNFQAAQNGADDAIPLGDIEDELRAGGVSEEEVGELAGKALEWLQDGYNKELRERAGKKGITAAEANDEIVADYQKAQEKKAIELGNAADAARRGAEKKRSDEVDERLGGTGADERARAAFMQNYLATGSAARAQGLTAASLSQELQKSGMGKDEADIAAAERIDEIAKKLGDEVVRGQFKGVGGEEMKSPQQRDLLSFARDLTVGDIPRQTLDINKQQLEQLVRIANKDGRATFG